MKKNKVLGWLHAHWPYCRKDTVEARVLAVRHELDDTKRRILEQAEADQEKIAGLLKDLVKTTYRQPENQMGSEVYELRVSFDARVGYMFAVQARDQMDYLGKIVGRQVAREIATSRFVAKAEEEEQRRWERTHPVPPEWRKP